MLFKNFIDQCGEYLAGYRECFLNLTNTALVRYPNWYIQNVCLYH